jgi:hypothetical protein
VGKKTLSALVGAVAVAAIGMGCGGGEAAPLSKAEFIAQGNSICGESADARDAALKEAAKESAQGSEDLSSAAELEKFVTEAVLPAIEEMNEQLAGLGAPKRDETKVAAIVAGFEEGAEAVEANPRSALGRSPFADANRLAADYGLTDCAI